MNVRISKLLFNRGIDLNSNLSESNLLEECEKSYQLCRHREQKSGNVKKA